MDIKAILDEVDDYSSFFNLDEINKRAFELAKKYDFEIKEVGRSLNSNPIYLIKAGNGPKKAFLFGFPHPNEPIGSLTVDWLIDYFGKNPNKLAESGFTWYFIYTVDPDGTKLNEGWFKGDLTIKKYFLNYYRPFGEKQVEWTFPVKYKDFEWNNPMPETKVLMSLINEIKPDLMYPLHNSGFGGAYFFSNKKFEEEYYQKIMVATKNLGIPLHLGEPELDFMDEIVKPFYFMFGLKEYYDYRVKLGKDPKILRNGDNSASYLSKVKPSAISIVGEIPYFFDEKITDDSFSKKSRREIWLEVISEDNDRLKFYSEIIPQLISKIDESDIDYNILKGMEREFQEGNKKFKDYVLSSSDFDRKATNAEVFDCIIGSFFESGLAFGQLRRAAIKAKLNEADLNRIDQKIEECDEYIKENSKWKVFPIKKLIQLQLFFLFETLKKV